MNIALDDEGKEIQKKKDRSDNERYLRLAGEVRHYMRLTPQKQSRFTQFVIFA